MTEEGIFEVRLKKSSIYKCNVINKYNCIKNCVNI